MGCLDSVLMGKCVGVNLVYFAKPSGKKSSTFEKKSAAVQV